MGFMDRAKSAAEQASAKAKETAGDVKTKHALGEAYDELGKLAFELASSGELANDKIAPLVEKISALKAQLED